MTPSTQVHLKSFTRAASGKIDDHVWIDQRAVLTPRGKHVGICNIAVLWCLGEYRWVHRRAVLTPLGEHL